MQSLYPDQFDALMAQVRQIGAVLGRTLQVSGNPIAVMTE